ncbi:MAG: polysaccharide deacetylase family protein [Betaproteobacteria bacterium]|nr:polysaccharide deacetylase family protein [Betaproteobacteria bacterium]
MGNITICGPAGLDPISARLLRGAGTHGPVVLMYHSISPGGGTPDWLWSVSYQRFVAQLDMLQAAGWTTACVSDLANCESIAARTAVITFDDGYADNYPAFEALLKRGMRATWFIPSEVVGQLSGWTKPARQMLSTEQLREIAGAGMEIGAHGRTHCRLTQVGDDCLQNEVADSKTDLARVVGAEIRSFAYPYGDQDDRVVQAVRNAGFRLACGTDAGWAFSGSDPFRIRRLSVLSHDGLSVFARKLALGSNNVSWKRVGCYAYERARARFLSRSGLP